MKVYLAGKITGTHWREELLADGATPFLDDEGYEWMSGENRLALTKETINPAAWEPSFNAPKAFPVWKNALRHGHDLTGPYFLDSYEGRGYDSSPNEHGLLSAAGAFMPGGVPEEERQRWAWAPMYQAPRRGIASGLCLDAIVRCDVLFAWLDRTDAYGTLCEIGFAKGLGKRVWVGTKRPTEPELWFALSLADIVGEEDSAREAFDFCQGDARQILHDMPYKQYLWTSHWQNVRRLALEAAAGRCQICDSTSSLQVHHRTYKRRGHEAPEDVIALCANCHAKFHDKLPASKEK